MGVLVGGIVLAISCLTALSLTAFSNPGIGPRYATRDEAEAAAAPLREAGYDLSFCGVCVSVSVCLCLCVVSVFLSLCVCVRVCVRVDLWGVICVFVLV